MGVSTNFNFDTRTAILEAALEEFGRTGKDGTKVHAIVNRAGVNVRKFYEIFESKEEVYDEALKYAIEKLRTRIDQLPSDAGLKSHLLHLEIALGAEPNAASIIRWEAAEMRNSSSFYGAFRDISFPQIRLKIEEAKRLGDVSEEFDSDCLAAYCIFQLLLPYSGTISKLSSSHSEETQDSDSGTRTNLLWVGLTGK